MGDNRKMELPLYSNKLNVKKFENLLSNNDQGYKFFWLEAIMKLIPNGNDLFTFEDVINEMIVGAWKTVTHYHLRLGHTVNGNAENFLEHAIRLLYENAKTELKNKVPSRDSEYSCAMKSHFRKFGNQMSGSGNHLCNYASLLA